jgi:thiamine-monophosphate kinase
MERSDDVSVLIGKHKRPVPRVIEGQILINSGKVSAMMDISDGIASDLRHILKASSVGAQVHLDRIPLSENQRRVCGRHGMDPYRLATGGGEDYELLFTASDGIEDHLDFPVYQIGEIVSGDSLIWMADGRAVDFEIEGYNHF